MIVRGMRNPSCFMIAVGTMVGLASSRVITEPSAIEPGWQWAVWLVFGLSVLILFIGARFLLFPPIALETSAEGINIYYRSGNRSFTRKPDLLPWKLVTGLRLKHLDCKDNTFNWVIEVDLAAPPAFDKKKRNALHNNIFDDDDPSTFYIDTFAYNVPKETLLDLLQSNWQEWRKKTSASGTA